MIYSKTTLLLKGCCPHFFYFTLFFSSPNILFPHGFKTTENKATYYAQGKKKKLKLALTSTSFKILLAKFIAF